MGPKKKQQKMNGFLAFMLDMRPKLEAKGHVFPRGMTDVHPVCTPLWNALSEEQKKFYNDKAKGAPQVKQEKYDSRGVPISFKEREEARKKEEREKNYQFIDDLISQLSDHGDLTSQEFHFVHFNYAVATEEKEYPPCEVAVVKFSLLKGISDIYHDFIDPGKLRLGYSSDAKEHSEKTHLIPSYGFKLFNTNYPRITDSIKKILYKADGSIAPLFVLEEDEEKIKFILDWLIEKSIQTEPSYDRNNPFFICSLNKLFYELRRHADLDDPRLLFTSTSQVAEKLNGGAFDYCPNMACEWHEEQDRTKYCSLTRARNYAYVISDFCCEHYGLNLLPNRHCPAVIADEDRYEILPLAPKIPKLNDHAPAQPKSEDEEEDIEPESHPRLPSTQSRLLKEGVGTRIAAGFPTGTGMGRGVLGKSAFGSPGPVPGPSKKDSPPPVPKGRGRGLLLS